MPMIEANLNDVEAWGGETTTLPPGEYQLMVKAADVEQKEKDGKTKLTLVVQYEVISGEFAGKTTKAWFTMDFTKDGPRKRMKSLVVACGIQLSPNGSFDSGQLIGCKLNADVIHDEQEGAVDMITGQKGPPKVFTKVINERAFGVVSNTPDSGSVGVAASAPTSGMKVQQGLPGLSKVG